MSAVAAKAISWTESGLVPDSVIRRGIRRLLARKRVEIQADNVEHAAILSNEFAAMMRTAPVALVPDLANEQHYEVPAEFFSEVLGTHRKYSCCYWGDGAEGISEAEAASLRITCERAQLADGQNVLDLGCGWGSISLWIAENYPNSRVTSVSNSWSQREYIIHEANCRGLDNIHVVCADMNDFKAEQTFDRVVSVEMFEHMRNYPELFRRIDGWLNPGGVFFLHIFTHRTTPYEYIDNGPHDWMSRHFFSGGIMPSVDLPMRFQDHLVIDKRWSWNGNEYARTLRAWLDQMDSRRATVLPILKSTYGEEEASRWWMRWRMFFMACEELFQYGNGDEWFVSHYRFRKRSG